MNNKVILILSLLILTCYQSAYSRQIKHNGIIYELDDATATASIIEPYTNLIGDLKIPSIVTDGNDSYTITTVCSQAFEKMGNLRSIDLPHSITTIGNRAFADCTWLDSINIPNGVRRIPNDIFGKTGLKTLIIGTSLEELPDNLLIGARALNKIIFSDGNKSLKVNPYVFKDPYTETTKITEIYLGRTIEGYLNIGTNLTVLKIGPLVTSVGKIGNKGFLTELVLGENVRKIDNEAFRFYPLTKLILNDKLEEIGRDAFPSLKEIIAPSLERWLSIYFGNPMLNGRDTKLLIDNQEVTDLVIPESIKEVNSYAFTGYSLKRIIMHDGVTNIGVQAFEGTHPSEIKWSKDLNFISTAAFSGNVFKELVLPEKIEVIGSEAFYGSEIEGSLRVNATEIGEKAFFNHNLTEVSFGPRVKSIGADAFNVNHYTSSTVKCPITKVTIEDASSTITMDNTVFADNMAYVNIEEIYQGRNLEGNCFYNCRSLKKLTFGDNVTIIPTGAYYLATQLEQISFGPSIVEIGDAFYRCPLKHIVFKDGPTPIKCGRIGAVPYYEKEPIPESLYLGRNIIQRQLSSSDEGMIGGFLEKAYSLIIGQYVTDVPCSVQDYGQLWCYAYNPPKLPSSQVYNNQYVHVLKDRWYDFRHDEQWRLFNNLTDDILWVKPEKINISETSIEGVHGDVFSLKAEIDPTNSTKSINWLSSNPEVATVDQLGNVELIKMGSCTITAKADANDDLSAICKVTVNQTYVTSLTIHLSKSVLSHTPASNELRPKDTAGLYVSVYPSTAEIKDYSIEVSDSTILKINMEAEDKLTVTALKPGKSDIIVTAQDGSKVCQRYAVHVIQPATKLSLNLPHSCYVLPGEEFDIHVTIEPSDATYQDVTLSGIADKGTRYEKAMEVIHQEGNTFKVKCPSSGTYFLSFHTSECYHHDSYELCAYEDTKPCTAITYADGTELDQTEITIAKNEVQEYVIWTQDNAPRNNTRWEHTVVYDNEDAFSADAKYGDSKLTYPYKAKYISIQGNSQGSGKIIFQSMDLSGTTATLYVNVIDHWPKLVSKLSITTDLTNSIIYPGDEFNLTATVYPENADNKHVEWSSENEDVATIDNHGHVKVLAPGYTRFKVAATDGSNVASFYGINVSVEPTPIIPAGIVQVNGLYYKVDTELRTAEVIGIGDDDSVQPYTDLTEAIIVAKVKHEGEDHDVTSISDYALNTATNLTSVIIEASPISIALSYETFLDRLNHDLPIRQFTLNRPYTINSDYFIFRSKSLETITVAGETTEIVRFMFYGAENVKDITFGVNIKSIETRVFREFSSLQNVYCHAPTPPSVDRDTFDDDAYSRVTLYVPKASIGAYKAADIWKKFYDIQPLDANTGADTIEAEQSVTVYTASGILVNKAATPEDVSRLSQGIYIINGKKVYIK